MASRPRGLIITADDFGVHPAVNEAVERAHRDGVLTAASLMVGGPAAADAVRRASRLPGLRVGLHLVLVDGVAILPPQRIPDLVDALGRFGNDMAGAGWRFFFLPRVRRQLADEMQAQFSAFAATGLRLDHVNAHKHFHLHPTVLSLMLEVGREFGLSAVRLPLEPGTSRWLRPWIMRLRARLDQAGIAHNDQLFGLGGSGAMDEAALLDAISRAPDGVTEIYMHPATTGPGTITATMGSYRHDEELAALLSPRIRAALDQKDLPRGGYCDVFGRALR